MRRRSRAALLWRGRSAMHEARGRNAPPSGSGAPPCCRAGFTPGVPRGRLAPSPTGLLHLGNAWSFLLAWLAARVEGGRVVLRMEDIDPARSRREWARAICDDLRWLGLDWDEGPAEDAPHGDDADGGEKGLFGPYAQSRRNALYEQAFAGLERAGLVYPCYCTRKELRDLAGAPHGAADGLGAAGAAYPGTCRKLSPAQRREQEKNGRRAAWRLACPEGGGVMFHDAVLGPQYFTLDACGGDFALRRSDGVWAYQLAVVVDDARMGITQVVRGEDIVWSTPRQLLLFHLLGARPPAYAHVPLLYDAAGERLAKRHRSLALRALRDAGVRPENVVGWLARVAGLTGSAAPATAAGLCERLRREGGAFPWPRLPRGGVRVPDAITALLLRGTENPPLPESTGL